jgi:alpha-tubulin suppressor-like RCC1 family protein
MKRIILLCYFIVSSLLGVSQTCFVKIDVNPSHTVGIKQDSSIWAWGLNQSGQVGNGTTTPRSTPYQVGNERWLEIHNGFNHTIALKSDGTLWAWGSNSDGELGIGSFINKLVPTKIGTSNDWKTFICGAGHNLAIKTNGTLWAWGSNLLGELGNGNNTKSNVPIQIGTGTNWQVIEAGGRMSMAKKTDGTLWTWGSNSAGQIGNGTNTDSNIPILIAGTNWANIKSGYDYNLAIKDDGTLWSWGGNTFGQLGIGNTTNKNVPTKVGTATDWSKISAGGFSLAIKTDGTLWAWGWNTKGQYGNGTTGADSNIPLKIGTQTDWVAIDAGYETSFFIKSTSNQLASGKNSEYQFGNGGFTNSNIPVIIPCPTTAPFPIELQSFTAEHIEKSIALYWTTASEQNNKGFDIQQSSDGKQWNSIAWQEGKGNSAILNNYHFTDPYPIRGINYYRLAQQDYDGTVTYSKIVSVLYESDQKVRIYPNPVSDLLHIEIQDNQEYNLVIYNAHMRKLYDVNSDEPIDLDISKWSDGLYYVNVSSDQNSFTYPIVVRK